MSSKGHFSTLYRNQRGSKSICNSVVRVFNSDDQPIFVAFDVENSKVPDRFSFWIKLFDFF